ncbi:TetR/AcrR family transcriptional regulator [Corynebacterium marambiense]
MGSRQSPPRRNRAEHRAEMEETILVTAEHRLAQDGATGLGLRSIARDIGMAPSAIYRYFDGIDALLTTLIIRAYRDQAAEVRSGLEEVSVPAGASATERAVEEIVTMLAAARRWAVANPHRYALIYGSPVPGYTAPADTIAPASGVGELIIDSLSRALRPEGPRLKLADLTEETIGFWAQSYGMISFELFGHFVGSGVDPEALFLRLVREGVVRVLAGYGRAGVPGD